MDNLRLKSDEMGEKNTKNRNFEVILDTQS